MKFRGRILIFRHDAEKEETAESRLDGGNSEETAGSRLDGGNSEETAGSRLDGGNSEYSEKNNFLNLSFSYHKF